jgi:hypothetical protein
MVNLISNVSDVRINNNDVVSFQSVFGAMQAGATSRAAPSVTGLEAYPKISALLSATRFPTQKLNIDLSNISNAPLPRAGDRAGVANEIRQAMRDLGLKPNGRDSELFDFLRRQSYAESTYNMSLVGDTDRGRKNASRGALQFATLVQGDAGRAIKDTNGNVIPRNRFFAENGPQQARIALRGAISHLLNLFNNPYAGAAGSAYNMLASYQSGTIPPRPDFADYLSRIENAL